MMTVIYDVKGTTEAFMRVTREQAAENRERIVEAAARLFRDKGFDGVGVDAIMGEAGLTHGGFYGHFKSKEALAVEAVTRALDDGARIQDRRTSFGELVGGYLSERHRADRADGCAVAALSADIGRQGGAIRRRLTAGMQRQIDRIVSLMKHGTPIARRRRAIATYAGMVGALTLARAVDDPALAQEILAAARDTFGKGQA